MLVSTQRRAMCFHLSAAGLLGRAFPHHSGEVIAQGHDPDRQLGKRKGPKKESQRNSRLDRVTLSGWWVEGIHTGWCSGSMFYLPPASDVLSPEVLQVDYRQPLHQGLPGVRGLGIGSRGQHIRVLGFLTYPWMLCIVCVCVCNSIYIFRHLAQVQIVDMGVQTQNLWAVTQTSWPLDYCQTIWSQDRNMIEK